VTSPPTSSRRHATASDHAEREEQESDGLARRESNVLAAAEGEPEKEQGTGDAPRPGGPTQDSHRSHPPAPRPRHRRIEDAYGRLLRSQ
jgi:hypothetical protein